MARKARKPEPPVRARRVFTDEFRREAVQMLLDGHSAGSVVQRLGLSHTNLLYRWKRVFVNWNSSCTGSSVNAIF